MRKAKQFSLPEFGIFQDLTTRELKDLALYEQPLAEAPAVIFLKKGWALSNGTMPVKSEIDAWLIGSMIYRKN